MSYSNSNVAHLWANGIGYYQGSNMCADEISIYSYSTVIAQCLDREKKLFVVIDETLSPTTSKHRNYVMRAIPDSATIFYTHIKCHGNYDHVQFLSQWNGKEFDKGKRLKMITHFIERTFNEFKAVTTSTTLNEYGISDYTFMKYAETLDSYYGDCSLKTWLRSSECSDKKIRKFVRLYIEDASKVVILNTLFGKNTWDDYLQRVEPLLKAKAKREHLDRLRRHLGFRGIGTHNWDIPECPYSAKELRNLTPRQVLDIRFSNIYKQEKKQAFRMEARRYNGDFGWNVPQSRTEINLSKIRTFLNCKLQGNARVVTDNHGNEIYNNRKYNGWQLDFKLYVSDASWDNTEVRVDLKSLKSFIDAPDKHLFREHFWKMCELKMRRMRGNYLYAVTNYYKTNHIPYELSGEENHILNEFVRRFNNRREMEIKQELIKARREAQNRQEALEKIEVYKEQGLDGIRKMWRERLMDVPYDILYSPELCFGGNILLRFSKQEGFIETSKGIKVSFKDCHIYWRILNMWLKEGFHRDTRMAGYVVTSFENGILTAGCHKIALCEMQRMYDELCQRESA